MKSIMNLLVLSFITTSSFAQTAQQVRNIEKLHTELVAYFKDQDVKQLKAESCDINTDAYEEDFCLKSSYILADRQLNYVWGAIKKKYPRLITKRVLDEQRAFITKRNRAAALAKISLISMREDTENRMEELLIMVGDKQIAEGIDSVK